MTDYLPQPLYVLVSKLESAHCKEWRKQFHRNLDLEHALQEHCFKMETTVSRFRGGNVSVTVCIVDKVTSNGLIGYFRLARALEGKFTVERSTSSPS